MGLLIDLDDCVILLCGVSKGGIGGSTARQLAAAGATIVAVDLSQDILDATIADVERGGGRCHGIVANLTDTSQADPIVASVVRQFDRLDGVVNVAGGMRLEEWMPLEVTPTESFRQALNLNLEYVFRVCRDAAASMIERKMRGSFVNVGSISAHAAAPLHGPYGAAKAGLIALTRTMAFEWARYGIRANSVSPGATATEQALSLARQAYGGDAEHADKRFEEANKSFDLVWTSPDELANAIVFLLSDLASGISGQNLTVDSALSTKFCGGIARLTNN
jgi:NAD(P)-dependent dehydrogenase (short-subunit alcohol dehydrogenase family)